ncbi:RICIN domain-containing protein [Salinactinospora qingdaonensis]
MHLRKATAIATATLGLLSFASPASAGESAWRFISSAANSTQVLDAEEHGIKDGTVILSFTAHPNTDPDNQLWQLLDRKGDRVAIQGKESGKCITAGPTRNDFLTLQTCNRKNKRQQWLAHPQRLQRLIFENKRFHGHCLTFLNTNSPVGLEECDGATDQKWRITH